LSQDAIIVWPFKLVLGKQGGKGWWSSPVHPNATQSSIKNNNPGCSETGCVFNIEEDPSEYSDLADTLPTEKARLTAALAAAMATAFQTNSMPGYGNCITDAEYAKAHQNFLGPICTKG